MMHLLNKIILTIFLICVCSTAASAATLQQDVDAVVNKAIQEKRIVGAVVLVYQDGREIHHGVYGSRDRENHIAMTDDTIFRFASLSKPIVTIAALRLIDQGKLSLDDPVTKWLPAFKPKTNDGKTPIITIRHLLTHTAGLNYPFMEIKSGPYHQLGISDGISSSGYSLNEHMRRISLAPLVAQPGSLWTYSVATDVLGAVIEVAEGKSLADAVDDLVLNPLGMGHTGFILKGNPSLVSIPYMDHNPEPIRMNDQQEIMPFALSEIVFSPSRIFNNSEFYSGGGSMSGTAGDYVKLLESIRLNTLSLKSGTLDKLTSNQIGDLIINSGLGWGWTLGFAVLKSPLLANSPQAKGAYQWGGIWGHTWWVDPANKLTVVIMTNTAAAGLVNRPFPNEIRSAIYSHI